MIDGALRSATTAHLRGYIRTPVNLVMLAVIPVLFVRAFGASLSRFGGAVDISIPLRTGEALTALWAAIFLTALVGMHMRASAREADRRLVSCGLSPARAAVARLVGVAVLAVLPVLVAFAVLVVETKPANALTVLAAFYVAALLYAGLGVLIGSITPTELEGSFVLMLVFMFDIFLGSPLFANAGLLANLTPARAPSEIVIAGLDGSDHDLTHWLVLAGYAIVVLGLATWSFRREAGR